MKMQNIFFFLHNLYKDLYKNDLFFWHSPFMVGLSNKHTPLCMAEATLNVG